MIIYPAIDLKNGQAVRLKQGKMDEATVYSDDPVAVAKKFLAQGAEYLHVVDLDGAMFGTLMNETVLENLVGSVPMKIQVGGGVRSLESIEKLLQMGVHRVILGTAAVEDPDLVEEAVSKFGSERIVVGIDAHGGRVAVKGWVETSEATAADLGMRMRDKGVTRVIYTDIQRDGMLAGANIDSSAALAGLTGLQVIVSGGIASLKEVERLCLLVERGVPLEGAIVGKALYAGTFTLQEALRAAERHSMDTSEADGEMMQRWYEVSGYGDVD